MATYILTKTLVDAVLLAQEIDADPSLSSNVVDISWNSPNNLIIEMAASLPENEETQLGVVVSNHNPIIAVAKHNKIKEIDDRTKELINQGFTFASNVFSLSEPAQTNWIGLKTLESLLTWPMNITTKTDGEYSLAQANLNAFLGTGLAVKQSHLDSGRALKIQVNAATTIEAVNAVVDNR